MSGVETTDTIYKRRSDFNASTFFQHSTGIMESKAKPEEVLLTIQSPISNLVLLEPLHSTQKVIQEKPDAIQISLKVLLNEEFTFKLLGMGSFCIVNKPASLKKTIKNAISLMNANYL
jgi:predicted DNA-binding transcriptional regulator YafY